MTEPIQKLESAIQDLITGFEADTGLEVTGMFRNFDKQTVTVTLMRKVGVKEVEKVEMLSEPGF